MIIHRLHAENFLKYRELDLDHLPERGLILVSGANESGKSTIGETICFALFGRTFSLDTDDPRKLIRWGESQATVRLEFGTGDRQRYEVTRYLDDEGTYGARLLRLADGAELARGPEAVDRQLHALLRYGYEAFIESFYLAQRELTTPHPHSETIKVMAGIAPLARVRAEVEREAAREAEETAVTVQDITDTQAALAELDIDPSWLTELQNVRDALQLEHTEQGQRRSELLAAAERYRQAVPRMRRAQRRARHGHWLFTLLLLPILGLWGLWGLYTQFGDSTLAEVVNQALNALEPAWKERWWPWLLPAAGGATALGALVWLRSRLQLRRADSERAAAEGLARHLDEIRRALRDNPPPLPPRIVPLLERLRPAPRPAEGDDGDDGDDGTPPPPIDAEALRASARQTVTELQQRAARLAIPPRQAAEAVRPLADELQRMADFTARRIEAIEAAIGAEQQRREQERELQAILDTLRLRHDQQQHRNRVRATASSLLEAATHHLSHRFNQSVLRRASEALPRFTQDRYRHLKIDDQLDVRVFSNDKHDFMDFDEISSGTQRQVMLSLRLAMSQELLQATGCGPQFLFFDEPFAFFDQERIRHTLAALPHISDELTQVWVVAQEFPEGTGADVEIVCRADADTLHGGKRMAEI